MFKKRNDFVRLHLHCDRILNEIVSKLYKSNVVQKCSRRRLPVYQCINVKIYFVFDML